MKFTPRTLAIGMAATLSATSQGAVIAVLDSNTPTGTLYDRSTVGNTFSGLSGTFASNGLNFPTGTPGNADYWNATADANASPGFTDGSGDSASWTFTGIPANTMVDVYVNWRRTGQVNNTPDAPYTVNGVLVPGIFNQQAATPAGLTLNDPSGDSTNFAYLGQFSSGALGQIQVGVTHSPSFTAVDAAAISFVPEPSVALLGCLGMFGLLRRRR